jgi:hypothetical protein
MNNDLREGKSTLERRIPEMHDSNTRQITKKNTRIAELSEAIRRSNAQKEAIEKEKLICYILQ